MSISDTAAYHRHEILRQNIDFSSEAVRLGRESSRKQAFTQAMHWLRADLCSWDELIQLSRFPPFDVILDKSTSDAIATSESRKFTSTERQNMCPIVLQIVEKSGEITLSPVELLALHLVPWTQPGTTWVVLSYSSSRFDNLPHLADYWSILSRTPVQAPSGQASSSSAHVPQVFHWVYVLQRK